MQSMDHAASSTECCQRSFVRFSKVSGLLSLLNGSTEAHCICRNAPAVPKVSSSEVSVSVFTVHCLKNSSASIRFSQVDCRRPATEISIQRGRSNSAVCVDMIYCQIWHGFTFWRKISSFLLDESRHG